MDSENTENMRIISFAFILMLLLALAVVSGAQAEEYRLANGNIFRGQAVTFNDDGMVIKLDIGGFSERVPWTQLSQETLKRLVADPKAQPFAEPFIELPPEIVAKRKEIVIQPVPRIERAAQPAHLAAGLLSPAGLFIVAALLIANIYAGYEVAIFRHRPIPLVCALSAILPLVGPLIFLVLPTQAQQVETAVLPAEPIAAVAGSESGFKGKVTALFGKSRGGLTLATAEKSGPSAGAAQPTLFARGEFTFNRRFFETKFPGFFRIVPSEAEKDLVLVIKGARNEYVGKRISRISSSDLHLQLLKTGSEASIPFAEIVQVQVRHKDA